MSKAQDVVEKTCRELERCALYALRSKESMRWNMDPKTVLRAIYLTKREILKNMPIGLTPKSPPVVWGLIGHIEDGIYE